MNKEKLIEILMAMYENKRALRDIFERDGDEAAASQYWGEAHAIDVVIQMLTYEDYLQGMWDIYCAPEEAQTA